MPPAAIRSQVYKTILIVSVSPKRFAQRSKSAGMAGRKFWRIPKPPLRGSWIP